MTGTAYRRSAELAGVVGPYDGYARNAAAHQRVMRKHAAANDAIKPHGTVDNAILREATAQWQRCVELGATNGYRNAQASLLAPTGTIGLAMDCDTTGVEPDLALVKFKKLVGGGSMQIVNNTVPRALRTLGYQKEQIEAIVEYIAEHGHVVEPRAQARALPGLRLRHGRAGDRADGRRADDGGGAAAAQRGYIEVRGGGDPCRLLRRPHPYRKLAPGRGRGQLPRGAPGDLLVGRSTARRMPSIRRGAPGPAGPAALRSHNHRDYPHRLLVAGDGGLQWKTLGEISVGDYVAVQYGAEMWSPVPASLRGAKVSDRTAARRRCPCRPRCPRSSLSCWARTLPRVTRPAARGR